MFGCVTNRPNASAVPPSPADTAVRSKPEVALIVQNPKYIFSIHPREMEKSHKRIAETRTRMPQRIQVPGDTVDKTQMPAAGCAATICRTAISKKITECTSATMARLRLVRIENPPLLGS